MSEVKSHKANAKSYTQQEIDDIINECEQYRETLIKYCSSYFDYEYGYAEDCVQNAYVALLENLKKGKEIRNYYAWLYKVTMNYKNHALKEIITRRENEFQEDEEKGITIDRLYSKEIDYIDNMVTDEDINQIALTILSSLNKYERELYISHYIKKKKFKDIAKEMNHSYTAIRQRHYTMKNKIAKKIKNFKII